MSEIDLSRFVDVNIQYHNASSISATRDTVVMVAMSGTAGTKKGPYSSIDELAADYGSSTDIYKRAAVYFQHGGIKLLVLEMGASGTAAQIKTAILGLGDEYIVCAIPTLTLANQIAALLDTSGIHQKILVTVNATSQPITAWNVCLKVSAQLGAEMTIAAYLSRINFYEPDSVKDYNFTEEILTPEQNSDEVLGTVLENNNNVDMTVAERIINFGGNLVDGKDLVNQYSLIVLQQLLTVYIFRLLTSKIKGSTGLASIQATVAKVMRYFQDNDYLSLDKVWEDETLTVTKKGVNYKLIEKDEPLTMGYKFVCLPMQSLENSEINEGKAPAMYLFVADSHGIRYVTINGEVI